ncbi:MAG: bacteriocin [Bacteroidales bacterium]|nr:bacteriocin [Bacteroidales bacterium]
MNRFEIIETSKFDVLSEEEMNEVLGGDGACNIVYINCNLTIGSGNKG